MKMTTLEMLQKTINIQQGKEKPFDERLKDFVEKGDATEEGMNLFKEMFGIK